MSAPVNLRVEHLDDPLGVTLPKPRLSWQLPAGSAHQLAYRIRAGEWDSGRVESRESLLVRYDGPELRSGQRIEWTVKVWTDNGESDWAEPSWWEMGILHSQDWTARWIGPAEPEGDVQRGQAHSVWYFRGLVDLPDHVRRARLYVTALGVYEFFVNGVRVGDAELTPGFTSYRTRLQVQTFDVTDLLVAGENVLGAIVSGGWVKWADMYRDMPISLLAQLALVDIGGHAVRVGTDSYWLAARGEIRAADLQLGQTSDLRHRASNWCEPESDLEHWAPVATRELGLSHLTSSPAPPVRRTEEIAPLSIGRPGLDRQLVDFGQNINGWVRLSNLGPEGTPLALTYGETLGVGGDVTLANVTSPDQPAYQQDRVVSAGREGDVFEPRHATKGFRYVRIEGHPDDLGQDDVTGIVVHTDMRRTGWFECSDERLNRLHDAIVWTFRGNACDVPTDCPTRERAGYTGDWQTFVPTAAYLYDIAGLTTKWLADLAADQLPDGCVRHCVPEFTKLETQVSYGLPPGCAGFGDAAVIVPWEIYKAYGDRDLLVAQWPSMKAWVEYAANQARNRRHPDRIAARSVAAQYEQSLWDTGFHWGEWNEPDMPRDYGLVQAFMKKLNNVDHGNIATAYLNYSATTLARVAEVIGDHDAVGHYHNLAAVTGHAWRAEFLGSDGKIAPHTQASYVRALAFDLIPDELRSHAAEHLVELIREAGNHPGTGFLSTPYLLPSLADHGHLDVAYELLLQETPPSWLAMTNSGATTIWEHWLGIEPDDLRSKDRVPGLGSLNHYSRGSVAAFMHQYVGGIRLLSDTPAYRRFRVEPRPGGRLTWARAVHDSPYGRISVSWEILGEVFVLDLTVPAGSVALVRLPDGQSFERGPGTHRAVCAYQDFDAAASRPRQDADSTHGS